MDLHPIQLVEFDWSNAFNRQCNLNGFTPNSTGQIQLVKLGRNSLRFGCHNLNGFTPNSTGQMPLTGNVISMDLHPIQPV